MILSGGQYCAEGPENYYGKLLWIITMDNCGAGLEEIAESTDNGRTNLIGRAPLGVHASCGPSTPLQKDKDFLCCCCCFLFFSQHCKGGVDSSFKMSSPSPAGSRRRRSPDDAEGALQKCSNCRRQLSLSFFAAEGDR